MIADQQQPKNFLAWIQHYPAELWTALRYLANKQSINLYLVGGTVRNFFLDKEPTDVDLTIEKSAGICAQILVKGLKGATLVPLGRQEDAARVVWHGLNIDFSSFRLNTTTIEEDLKKRDFTINSMAVDLAPFFEGQGRYTLIDPLEGLKDLKQNLLRSCPGAFIDDPLRMLRAYRFKAALGVKIIESTREEIVQYGHCINSVSAERVEYELDCIMNCSRSYPVIAEMADSKLLFHILPELLTGVGVEQPGFHHLDVYSHSLEALRNIEEVISSPAKYFPENSQFLLDYLKGEGVVTNLKWAALFHDLGKPSTREISRKKNGRVTFYGHDQVGRELFEKISKRLKWSNRSRRFVSSLIAAHMHPFHLCNIMRDQKLSKRACLKLCKRAGKDLGGLFILAMADSLAGQGELKPTGMEKELAQLFKTVVTVYDEDIRPVLVGPKLLTGHDLIKNLNLKPGPLFAKILGELEVAQVAGEIDSKEQAIGWVKKYLLKVGMS